MPGYFQFLNLVGRDQEAAIPGSKFGGAGKVRYFSFTIPVNPQDKEKEKEKKMSQVRDLRLCNHIADLMRAEGFDVSKAGRGKPWGAVFTVRLNKFKVIVMLDAKRLPRIVKCEGLTWTHTPRWRRISSDVVSDEWARTREAIERVLRQDPKVNSLRWRTPYNVPDQDEGGETTSPNSAT